MNHFSIRLWCVMKVGQWWPAQWLNQEGAPKHFPKLNLHQKRSWSLFGGMWLVWTLVKPVHLRSMLSKSVKCTKKYSACNQHWSADAGPSKGPVLLHDNTWLHVAQPMLQKLNELGYEISLHLPYSPDLLSADYHFFKHLDNFFAEKMLPQTAGDRTCFLRVFQIPKHRFLCYMNK